MENDDGQGSNGGDNDTVDNDDDDSDLDGSDKAYSNGFHESNDNEDGLYEQYVDNAVPKIGTYCHAPTQI